MVKCFLVLSRGVLLNGFLCLVFSVPLHGWNNVVLAVRNTFHVFLSVVFWVSGHLSLLGCFLTAFRFGNNKILSAATDIFECRNIQYVHVMRTFESNRVIAPSEMHSNGHLWRNGDYVGDDYHLLLNLYSYSEDLKSFVEENTAASGAADINRLLGVDTPFRCVTSWEMSVHDTDRFDAVCVGFADEPPKQGFPDLLDKHPQVLGFLEYRSNALRGSVRTVLSSRKPLVEEMKIRWWSEETGFRDVSYAEFIRIHAGR